MRVLEELGGPTKKAVAIFHFLQLCLLLLVRILNDKIQLPLPPDWDYGLLTAQPTSLIRVSPVFVHQTPGDTSLVSSQVLKLMCT